MNVVLQPAQFVWSSPRIQAITCPEFCPAITPPVIDVLENVCGPTTPFCVQNVGKGTRLLEVLWHFLKMPMCWKYWNKWNGVPRKRGINSNNAKNMRGILVFTVRMWNVKSKSASYVSLKSIVDTRWWISWRNSRGGRGIKWNHWYVWWKSAVRNSSMR